MPSKAVLLLPRSRGLPHRTRFQSQAILSQKPQTLCTSAIRNAEVWESKAGLTAWLQHHTISASTLHLRSNIPHRRFFFLFNLNSLCYNLAHYFCPTVAH